MRSFHTNSIPALLLVSSMLFAQQPPSGTQQSANQQKTAEKHSAFPPSHSEKAPKYSAAAPKEAPKAVHQAAPNAEPKTAAPKAEPKAAAPKAEPKAAALKAAPRPKVQAREGNPDYGAGNQHPGTIGTPPPPKPVTGSKTTKPQ